MNKDRMDVALALTVLVLGSALYLAGNYLLDAQEPIGAGLASLVGLGVTAFGALILTWWCLTFCLALAAELLTRRGRPYTGGRLGTLAPVFMRRAACLALGANLLAAPAAHAGAVVVPATPAAAEHIHAAAEPSALSPAWVPVEVRQPLEPSWLPSSPPPEGGLLVKETRESLPSHDTAEAEIVVRPGDSLWNITARHLGQTASDMQVAETWPRWYEANRHVIGKDPHLLRPGQILHPPTGTPSDLR